MQRDQTTGTDVPSSKTSTLALNPIPTGISPLLPTIPTLYQGIW